MSVIDANPDSQGVKAILGPTEYKSVCYKQGNRVIYGFNKSDCESLKSSSKGVFNIISVDAIAGDVFFEFSDYQNHFHDRRTYICSRVKS